jgi:hypothetical protein
MSVEFWLSLGEGQERAPVPSNVRAEMALLAPEPDAKEWLYRRDLAALGTPPTMSRGIRHREHSICSNGEAR